MYNSRNNYYKIGRCIYPEFREKILQAEEPDVKLIEKWVASAEVETTLHCKFKNKRIRGEWFALTETDLKELKTLVTIYQQSNQDKGNNDI